MLGLTIIIKIQIFIWCWFLISTAVEWNLQKIQRGGGRGGGDLTDSTALVTERLSHSPRVAAFAALLPGERIAPMSAARSACVCNARCFKTFEPAYKILELGYELFDPGYEYLRPGYNIQSSVADFQAGFGNFSRGLNILRWASKIWTGVWKFRTGPRNFCNRWHRIRALPVEAGVFTKLLSLFLHGDTEVNFKRMPLGHGYIPKETFCIENVLPGEVASEEIDDIGDPPNCLPCFI